MDIRHFRTFVKVVELESFSKAAEALSYSQAAVTVQIKQLEETLGVILFDRLNQQIRLTEDGKRFVYYANEVLRAYERALEFRFNDGEKRGLLRIGTVDSLATSIFPELIDAYHRINPYVQIRLEISRTEELVSKLNHNELDLMHTLDEKIYAPDLVKTSEHPERILFVTSDKRFKEKKLRLEDIVNEPFLLTEENASYRYELERYLASCSLSLETMVEVGNTDVIVKLLKKGLGISFVPYFSVKEDLEEGSLFELDLNVPEFYIWSQIFHHKQKYLNEAMLDWIALTQDYYASVKKASKKSLLVGT